MPRRFTEPRLVLATHNQGKVAEFGAMLAPRGVTIVPAAEFGLAEPEETGSSFAANAQLKAEAAVAATGLPALADDSGLAVRGLDGQPGILSARWAGPSRDFRIAMGRVVDALTRRSGSWAAADKHAEFIAVLCLAWPDGHLELAEGRVAGSLVPEPQGSFGFGYDPIFLPDGETRTFGQISTAEKYALSHRRRAVDALMAACFPE